MFSDMSFEKLLTAWSAECGAYHLRTRQISLEITRSLAKMTNADAKKAIAKWESFARKSESKLQKRLAEIDDMMAEKETTINFTKKRKVSFII